MEIATYPKRLIEVDLPIARISAHARREKSIRHGHISTLHIWWARRPLAACRAVICASLWPDPVDLTAWAERGEEISVGDGSVIVRPRRFLDTSREQMTAWAKDNLGKVSKESYPRFVAIQNGAKTLADPLDLQRALLDFIADFANWDNSTDKDYLETARALTQAAHEALGGEPETRPLVVDPFAGGGSIPLEALRVGADAFASDLNPVAVLLNKVVLEYIPKYGQRLADEVRKWGAWIKQEAEKELAEFYPKDPDGATPIAYLWARTIQCEGPGCGAEVPMINQLWIKKKGAPIYAFKLSSRDKKIGIQIVENPSIKVVRQGTARKGSVTCPACGFTTPADKVRQQGCQKGLGNRLLGVVLLIPSSTERRFREPTINDLTVIEKATQALKKLADKANFSKNLLVKIPLTELRRISVPLYGIETFDQMFTLRQQLSFNVIEKILQRIFNHQNKNSEEAGFKDAVATIISLAISNTIHYNMNLSTYLSNGMVSAFIQGTSIAMRSDFAEANPLMSKLVGGIEFSLNQVCMMLDRQHESWSLAGTVEKFNAISIGLPDDSAALVATDPPYYDSVPYSHLSDIFYIWLKSSLTQNRSSLFSSELTEKADEIVEDRAHSRSPSRKRADFYEKGLLDSFAEARRIVANHQLMVVVFAHKSTRGWESMLNGLLGARWTIVGSWPIDTERPERMNAYQNASLLSSVHVACRPLSGEEVGDWRDVLTALPQRIHDWMPRLADEGVVGADAIFACLGPALEIFSRYSRVEKSSGEAVTLKEYLEHVWAAVSKEALSMIFKDPDTAGLEPDARLTAMWLWTLGASSSNTSSDDSEETEDEEADEESGKAAKVSGFTLEFDAARKIAQGLGVHLEKSPSVVEVKGDTAKLLSVAERVKYLFGKDAETTVAGKTPRKKKKEPVQQSLFAELQAAESAAQAEWGDVKGPKPGSTVLDRLHQAMILFAAGRGEAMKHFIVEEGIGSDARFWKLAQSLTALYPGGSDEKRWVDGVLARKKGLGF